MYASAYHAVITASTVIVFQDLNPQPLPPVVNVVFEAITYTGVVLSLVCLIALVLTYMAVK